MDSKNQNTLLGEYFWKCKKKTYYISKKKTKVFEPCCGRGGFIIEQKLLCRL